MVDLRKAEAVRLLERMESKLKVMRMTGERMTKHNIQELEHLVEKLRTEVGKL